MSNEPCLNVLLTANARLANFFDRFSGMPVQGTQQEVEALSQVELALHSVGNLLNQGVQQSNDKKVREELAKYGTHLLRLQRELAVMQGVAADCRARLSARQKHLQAAQAWCNASQASQ